MDESRIKKVCEAYEKKVDIFRDYQLGKDLNAVKFPVKKYIDKDTDAFLFQM